MAKKKTQEQFIQDIINKFNIKREDFELLSNYEGYDKPIIFKCNQCGLTKKVIAGSLLKLSKRKKHICRCYGYGEKWKEQLKEFNNWKKTQKDFEILEDFRGVEINLKVKCLKCGAEQNRSIESLIKKQPCLCCTRKHSIRKTHSQFLAELKDLYGEEYEPVEKYISSDTPILIRHVTCGKIYKTKPHNLLTNKGGHCPICKIVSKGEKAIIHFLEQNNINFEAQKRLEQLKKSPYDFYLPDFNLLIEYQGKQHFEPVKRFGGEKTFKRQQEIDLLKEKTAKELQYNYLAINYKDFKNIDTILAQRLSCGEE